MVCINNRVNVKQKKIFNMNAIRFLSVKKILVFRTFLSENCYTYFLTLVL